MIICLSCYHTWPEGSVFCGNCQRTFHGRRCLDAHLSPSTARYCIICGSPDLSACTKSIRTGPFFRVVAWILALFILKPLLIAVGQLLLVLIGGLIVLDVILQIVFGSSALSGFLGPLLIVHLTWRLVRSCFHGIKYIVQGHSSINPPTMPPRRY